MTLDGARSESAAASISHAACSGSFRHQHVIGQAASFSGLRTSTKRLHARCLPSGANKVTGGANGELMLYSKIGYSGQGLGEIHFYFSTNMRLCLSVYEI